MQNSANQQIAIAREETIAKQYGSLGKMAKLAEWLASWHQTERPLITKPLLAIFAGNHGLIQNHFPHFNIASTAKQVERIVAGHAVVNQICLANSLSLKVFDLALDLPSGDIVSSTALTPKACAATMAFGMEVIAGGVDLLCLGTLGEGNELIASVVCQALYGGSIEDWVLGADSIDTVKLDEKLELLLRIIESHKAYFADPFDVLYRLAGREISASVGAILAARIQKIPVILDGFVSTTAAAVLHSINPAAISHCLVGHLQKGGAHELLCSRLALDPLYLLDMQSGVGCGAAMGAHLLQTAALCHNSTLV